MRKSTEISCSQCVTDAQHKIYVTAQIFISNVIVMHEDRDIVSQSTRRVHILNMSLAFRFMYERITGKESQRGFTISTWMLSGYFSISRSVPLFLSSVFFISRHAFNNKSKHIKCDDAHLDMLSLINASAFRIYSGNWNFLLTVDRKHMSFQTLQKLSWTSAVEP